VFVGEVTDEVGVASHGLAVGGTPVREKFRECATRNDGERHVQLERGVYDGFGGLVRVHTDQKRWIEFANSIADGGILQRPKLGADVRERSDILCSGRGGDRARGFRRKFFKIRRQDGGVVGGRRRSGDDVVEVLFRRDFSVRDESLHVLLHSPLLLFVRTRDPHLTSKPCVSSFSLCARSSAASTQIGPRRALPRRQRHAPRLHEHAPNAVIHVKFKR